MEIIFVLIVICLAAAVFFLISFIWAVKTGQFDDDQTPAIRILLDEYNQKFNSENK